MTRLNPAASRMLIVAAAILACALAACSTATGPAGLPTTACDNAARVATTDPVRNARRLDPVLLACTSIHDLEAVGSKYGIALVGSDIVGVARTRCQQPGAPRGGSLCPAIVALDAGSEPRSSLR
jgi:hypothetical protein